MHNLLFAIYKYNLLRTKYVIYYVHKLIYTIIIKYIYINILVRLFYTYIILYNISFIPG